MKKALAVALFTTTIWMTMGLQAEAFRTDVDERKMGWMQQGYIRWMRAVEIAAAAEVADVAETVEAEVEEVAGGIAGIIYDIFGVHGAKAVAVASCESGLDPNAVNPSGASGLFQLMPIHFQGRFDPFDPVANARYAYQLSAGGTNWSAWSGACA